MAVKFNCPKCDQSLKADDAMQGKKVRCPSCNSTTKFKIREKQPLVQNERETVMSEKETDTLKADDAMQGKKVRCPSCNSTTKFKIREKQPLVQNERATVMSEKKTDTTTIVLGVIIVIVALVAIGMVATEKSKVTMKEKSKITRDDVNNELNKFREEVENHPDKNMRSLGRKTIKNFESEIDELK